MTNVPFPPGYDPEAFRGPLEVKFFVFHQKNPEVYWLYREFAFQWVNSGRGHCGIRLIVERVRWQIAIKTTGDVYKLNDHHDAYYARLLWELEPTLRELFRFRKLKTPCTFGPSNDELTDDLP